MGLFEMATVGFVDAKVPQGTCVAHRSVPWSAGVPARARETKESTSPWPHPHPDHPCSQGPVDMVEPKRIAAVVTTYFKNSHGRSSLSLPPPPTRPHDDDPGLPPPQPHN